MASFWLRISGRFFIFLALMALVSPLHAAENLPHARFSRAISMHGVLNWPKMEPGSSPVYVWPPFNEPRYALQDEKLQKLKTLGFQAIRLTVGLGIFLSADEAQKQELDAILLDRVKHLIQAGFVVIVDFHPIKQDKRYYPLSFTRAVGEPLVEEYRAFLVRVAQLLNRLPKEKIALEIMNEPMTKTWNNDENNLWQDTQKSYYDSVRQVAPKLTLVLTGCCSCCGLELLSMDFSRYKQDHNLYYTFHFYSPHGFTHQGALNGASPFAPLRFLDDIRFPLDEAALAALEQRAREALTNVEGGDEKARMQGIRDLDTALLRLKQYPSAREIEAAFDQIADHARKSNVDPKRIFLGEFGVMRPKVDLAARKSWLEIVRKAAEKRGFPWAYWSLEQPEYMGLQLDIEGKKLDPVILEALGLKQDKKEASPPLFDKEKRKN